MNQSLETRIRSIIQTHPTYGLRRIWAHIRFGEHLNVNRKRIHRLIKKNNWQIQKKIKGHRPRVKAFPSRSDFPNQRWAIDATHAHCGKDGWCHILAVIDCCNREILGWRFAQSGHAKPACAALEDAVFKRKLEPSNSVILRSDNGLIFGSKAFTQVANTYHIQQEFITPYSPQQNGMIERFFRTLKEECIWQHTFENADNAFLVIADWMDWYNHKRPHSALGYQAGMNGPVKLLCFFVFLN